VTSSSEIDGVYMSARSDEFRNWYWEAARDAFEEGEAILEKAVEKAEARRRFHVDSQGHTAIAYAGPEDLEEAPAGRSAT